MLVSIIMPAYNASPYVEQAIRSLQCERGGEQLDIIVIDDGSTDDTVGVVRKLMQRDPEIRLIEIPHQGISAARNRGLSELPDDVQYVTFHDADDIAYPGRIKRQLALLQADPDAQVVYGLLQMFDVLDDETLLPSPAARTFTTRTIHLSVGLYRRPVIDQLGRFDETMVQAEDTDFLLRLVESGTPVTMEDEIATFYRRHDTNTTHDIAVAQREFMRAICRSVHRRRLAGGDSIVPLASSMFSERTHFEGLFETCPPNTPS